MRDYAQEESKECVIQGCKPCLVPRCSQRCTVQVRIAMVGKYTGLADAYLSVIKSLQHACLAANRKLEILWVEASHLEDTTKQENPEAHKVGMPATAPAESVRADNRTVRCSIPLIFKIKLFFGPE